PVFCPLQPMPSRTIRGATSSCRHTSDKLPCNSSENSGRRREAAAADRNDIPQGRSNEECSIRSCRTAFPLQIPDRDYRGSSCAQFQSRSGDLRVIQKGTAQPLLRCSSWKALPRITNCERDVQKIVLR